MKKVLIINGAIRGAAGNSGALANAALQQLPGASLLDLTAPPATIKAVHELLLAHDAFLIVTGVYWNNWGSPLQRFLEVATAFENSPAFFGKPVACAVTMDAVGGIEVAARIHAAFSGLGCWSPPCSSLVLSRVAQEAINASREVVDNPNEDVWRIDDLVIVLKNLVTAASMNSSAWVAWPHVALKISDGPWPATGILDMQTPRFL